MVHHRHNESESNPNPYVNFIAALPTPDDPARQEQARQSESNPNPYVNFIAALPTPDDPARQEQARQLLRALAAQVKPVMKAHGFVVNSLEEVCGTPVSGITLRS